MAMDQNRVDQVLDLLGELSVDELEHVSKALKKMLFRCRVQEKIALRRYEVARAPERGHESSPGGQSPGKRIIIPEDDRDPLDNIQNVVLRRTKFMAEKKGPLNEMASRSTLLLFTLLFFSMVFISACRSTGTPRHASDSGTGIVKYTKYNIHAQQSRLDIKASYAGYVDSGVGHFFIPPGSKIHFPDKGHSWRNGFWFTVVNTGQKVFFEFHSQRMGMMEQEYIDLITSDTPVSLDKFSEIDRNGIKAGTVYTGMSKQGVLTALGYPARHRTPSLDANTWVYWRNRFMTMAVVFDKNGVVRSITQ